MKILWMSDSPTAPSGFGNVTRFVCAGLANRGHQVSILDRQVQDQPMPWQNCMRYAGNKLNAEALLNYLRQLQPDILITLAEVAWIPSIANPIITEFRHTAGIPWALYYPIDSDMGQNRLPPSLARILKMIDLPIAISLYTRNVTQTNGIAPAYIPLGVDTKVFQPPADKELAKQAFGYQGKFVILSDARNQPRKMLPRTLEIFQRFAVDKDDVILHLHCDSDDPASRTPGYCYDLRSDIAFLNLTEKVYLTKDMSIFTGISLEQLAQIYQAADVHLLASWGEGFGLPTLQAAAAGVVSLASDYSASQELVQGHGETIDVRYFLRDHSGLHRALIDIDDAVNKLETLYRDRQLLAHKAQSSREFALAYDWECLLPQWEELLMHEIARKKMSLSSPLNVSDIPNNPSDEESLSNPSAPKASESETEPLQDEVQVERTLTIPVTLPLTKSKQRIPGYVYAASQRDVPAVLALRRIFPGLKIWSTISLDFGSLVSEDKPFQVKVIEANGSEYRPHLALSTLALDMGSSDPRLPIEAAKLGVPCIGLAQQKEQARLWPELSLEKPDPMRTAELGRQMLTDQRVAGERCLNARHRLAKLTSTSFIYPLHTDVLV